MKSTTKMTLICDECKKDEISAEVPQTLQSHGLALIQMYAEEAGWVIDDDGKSYCPMCIHGEWMTENRE